MTERRKPAIPQNDETHLTLVNTFIDQLNEATIDGFTPPFIASAAVAAAAAYSVFAHINAGVPITEKRLDTIAGQFRDRMVVSHEQRLARDARGTGEA